MTGIAECTSDQILNVANDPMRQNAAQLLTIAEHAACLLDPRYLTWRQMTV